jgi:hypothetical protein
MLDIMGFDFEEWMWLWVAVEFDVWTYWVWGMDVEKVKRLNNRFYHQVLRIH